MRLTGLRLRPRLAILSLLLAGTAPADAQSWPSKPITIVTAFALGAVIDLAARAIAQDLSEALGQLHQPARHATERLVGREIDLLAVGVAQPRDHHPEDHQGHARVLLEEGVEVRGGDRQRVERAAHLLRTTDTSVDRIAEIVGYADGATLRTLLRRRLGKGVREIRGV